VAEHLSEILIVATELLRAQQKHEDAAAFGWIAPTIDGVIASVDADLKRIFIKA